MPTNILTLTSEDIAMQDDNDFDSARGMTHGVWIGALLWALIISGLLLLSGCMTENTRTQLATSEAQIQNCWEKAVAYQHAALANVPAIKSEVGALFYLSIVQQNQDKLFASCDDAFIALLNSHNVRYAQNVGLTKMLGGLAIGAYAVDSVVSTMANNMGGNSTTTIAGSRVISGSGNGATSSTFSSSGEGLGQANTFTRAGANGQTISGFEPRTNPVQTENIDTNSPQSASGTNEASNPIDGGDGVPVEGTVEIQ
jgi:hypothetical protein